MLSSRSVLSRSSLVGDISGRIRGVSISLDGNSSMDSELAEDDDFSPQVV